MLTQRHIQLICDDLSRSQNTVGILLCGSYAYGEPTEGSDLDIRVITNDGSNLDGRGLRLFGTPIELLVNSPERVRANFQECVITSIPYTVHFWAHGTVLLDRIGIVAELQREARELWARGPQVGIWRHTKTCDRGRIKYTSVP